MKRLISIAAAVLLFVAVAATPASATVSKSGTKGCTINQTGVSRSYSTGFTEHFPPGSGYGAYQNGQSWIVRERSATVAGGGFWFVRTDGSLSDPGTYAYCITGTP